MGLTTILLRKVEGKENKEFLESILNNSKRLKILTENMLDVAKIQNNTLKINKKTINLNLFISNIVKKYNPEITSQEKTINYKFNCKRDDILIEADPDRLKQIFLNLLENSLNFTNSGDFITVIVEKVQETDKRKKGIKEVRDGNKKDYDKTVGVSIIDTGEGISPEIFNNLFSKFNTKNSVKGSGLGLYISKKIIYGHNGRIWAENPINKKGAIFKFALPIKN